MVGGEFVDRLGGLRRGDRARLRRAAGRLREGLMYRPARQDFDPVGPRRWVRGSHEWGEAEQGGEPAEGRP
jgi:hypothetical protein